MVFSVSVPFPFLFSIYFLFPILEWNWGEINKSIDLNSLFACVEFGWMGGM